MCFDQWGEEKLWEMRRLYLSNILNEKKGDILPCLNALLLLMCILCCRINSWRWFKVELIDSQHGFSSILLDWKLKLPQAWFYIWSKCDGPDLDREPSGIEKGIRAQPVLNAKPTPHLPISSLQQKTTSLSHSGWPFKLNPFNPLKIC